MKNYAVGRTFFGAFLVMLVLGVMGSGYALAQEAPPPQNTDQDSSDLDTSKGSEVSTSSFEKALLGEFFKALNESQQSQSDGTTNTGTGTGANTTIGDIVSDVLKTVAKETDGGADAETSDSDSKDEEAKDDDDDNDGDEKANSQGKKKKKKKKNKGKNKDKGKSKDKSEGKGKGKNKGLPPGLQKQLARNGTLPPGLQSKLEDSGELPPGLQARALPAELEAELPALPAGQKRVIADQSVLIIDEVLGTVLDKIPNIIPPELATVLGGLPDLINP